jgi:hypothetical protein
VDLQTSPEQGSITTGAWSALVWTAKQFVDEEDGLMALPAGGVVLPGEAMVQSWLGPPEQLQT